MNRTHCFRRSTRISKRTLLAHLLLSQRNVHLGENACQNNGSNTASADRLTRRVEGLQDVGNALQYFHLRSLHGKTRQILRGSESSRKNNRLESKQEQRRTSYSEEFSCAMSFTFDRAILRYNSEADIPGRLDEDVSLLFSGFSLTEKKETKTIQ